MVRSNIILYVIAVVILVLPVFLIDDQVIDGMEESRASMGPQWPTFKFDSRRTGNCPHNLSGNMGELLWKTEVSPIRGSSPVIGEDGSIYVGCRNFEFRALYEDGSPKWKYMAGDEITCTPSLDIHDNVYFSSMDGIVHCLDKLGNLLWDRDLNSTIDSSPLVVSPGLIIISTVEGKVYALDSDGEVQWNYTADGKVRSSPTISKDGLILVTSLDGFLHAISVTGDPRWKFYLGDGSESTPCSDDEGNIYVGSNDKGVYGINKTGGRLWRYPMWGEVKGSPSLHGDGGIIVDSGSQGVVCLGDTGGKRWDFDTTSVVSTPASVSSDGNILFGTGSGMLYCLDGQGRLRWTFALDDIPSNAPAINSDGTIIITDISGNLYKLGTHPRSPPWTPTNFTVSSGESVCLLQWDPPAFDGNSPITGYRIYRKAPENPELIPFQDLWYSERDFLDNSVENGVEYTYAVSALNSHGESALSIPVKGTPEMDPEPPGAPEWIKATSWKDRVALTWGPARSEGSAPIEYYRVFRYDIYQNLQKEQDVNWGLYMNDTVPERGAFYYYQVAAVNEVGMGDMSSMVRIFVPKEQGANILDPVDGDASQDEEIQWDAGDWICCLSFLFMIVIGPVIAIIWALFHKKEEKVKAPQSYFEPPPQQPSSNPAPTPSPVFRKDEIPQIVIEGHEDKGAPARQTIQSPAKYDENLYLDEKMDLDDMILEKMEELKEMYEEGEIDREMYDEMKKRLARELET
ncbi:MAG: PQQ-binding-like beta-propeller repeat protein [Thermoplasmatota archaeon]